MRRSWDLPGSCEILVLMPRSSTPVRLHRLAKAATPFRLPLCAQRRLSRIPFFRGSFTQPVHPLCTLRSSGRPETTQHSVLGRWLAFAGRDSHPLDSYARFRSSVTRLPPCTGLPGARTIRVSLSRRRTRSWVPTRATEHPSSAIRRLGSVAPSQPVPTHARYFASSGSTTTKSTLCARGVIAEPESAFVR